MTPLCVGCWQVSAEGWLLICARLLVLGVLGVLAAAVVLTRKGRDDE